MKRKSLLFIMMFALLSGSAWAQTLRTTTTLPWSENFESYTSNDLGSEWAIVRYEQGAPCVVLNNDWCSPNGKNALELRSRYYYCIVALPLFDKPLSSLTISFNYCSGSTTAACYGELGYVTDVNDYTSFHNIVSLNTPAGCGSLGSGHYSSVSYNLANYNVQSFSDYRLAIKFYCNERDPYSWYFDDFNVTYTAPAITTSTMQCGVTYSGTVGTSGIWNHYTNCNNEELGGERAYAYTPPTTGSYTFTTSTTSGDPDFFLMEMLSNSATSLIDGCWEDGSQTITLTGGHTYYLIVDNRSQTNNADYTVSVSCPSFPLTFAASPEPGGTVSVSDNGSNVSSGSDVEYSSVLDITATPNPGFTFTRWMVTGEGASVANVNNASTTFTMGTAAASLTAIFTEDTPVLSITDITGNSATASWSCYTASTLRYGEAIVSVDFETNNMSQASFTYPDDYPWKAILNKHSGWYCACSDNIHKDNSTASMQLEVTLNGPGLITFDAIILSEWGCDKGYFYIDGQAQSGLNGISGDRDWQSYSYPLSAGTHTLKWSYKKDGQYNEYGDRFCVDDIRVYDLANTVNTNNTTYNLTGLSPDTYYGATVQGTYSETSEPVFFKTLSTLTLTADIEGYGNGTGKWYLITSPLNTAIAPTAVANMIPVASGQPDVNSADYDLYYFDQTQNEEWRNYKQASFSLEPGTGYLYANKGDVNNNPNTVTLSFTGVPYLGNGQITLSKTSGSQFEGWNLIGNPFNGPATLGQTAFYRMNSAGDEVEAATVGSTIAAMEGVFVIADTDGQVVTFTEQQASPAPTPGDGIAQLSLNVSNNRGASTGSATTIIDRAIVRFDEGGLLPKFQLNSNSTKIYFTEAGQDFAVVRSAYEGEMPVSFHAAANGTYTLSVEVNTKMTYLHLIDNLTGADVDLLANPSYTFKASTNDYASRFRLVFSANDENSASADSETFAYYNGSEWVVTCDGTLQVVDMMGRVLSSETINGNTTLNLNQPTGIYMLRLVNDDNVRVQKIVVR